MTRWALALAALFAAFTVQAQTPEPRSKPSVSEEQRQKVCAARQKASSA